METNKVNVLQATTEILFFKSWRYFGWRKLNTINTMSLRTYTSVFLHQPLNLPHICWMSHGAALMHSALWFGRSFAKWRRPNQRQKIIGGTVRADVFDVKWLFWMESCKWHVILNLPLPLLVLLRPGISHSRNSCMQIGVKGRRWAQERRRDQC